MIQNRHFTIISGTLLSFAAGFAFSSCDNHAANKSIHDLSVYVQKHRDSIDRYSPTPWDSMDNGYQIKIEAIVKDTADMSQALRDSLYTIDDNWSRYKRDYESREADRDQIAAMDDIRKTLAIDSVNLDYSNLGAEKIETEFTHFLTVVRVNKNNYNDDQWVVIDNSWKQLNDRKKEIEKNGISVNETKIVKMQAEYANIKANNKSLASLGALD